MTAGIKELLILFRRVYKEFVSLDYQDNSEETARQCGPKDDGRVEMRKNGLKIWMGKVWSWKKESCES